LLSGRHTLHPPCFFFTPTPTSQHILLPNPRYLAAWPIHPRQLPFFFLFFFSHPPRLRSAIESPSILNSNAIYNSPKWSFPTPCVTRISRIVNLATATIMVLGGIAQFFNFNLYVLSDPPDGPQVSTTSTCARARIPRATAKPLHRDEGDMCQGIIVGAYVIIFGLCTALLEFQIPPQVSRYASFLFSFVGRGVFYIFIGSILLSDGVFKIIAGSIVGLIGVAYVVLEFVPQIEPPANMREADGGWGAEQV
ncbi:COPI associated protein, partial [Colletotrichum cuscutae]